MKKNSYILLISLFFLSQLTAQESSEQLKSDKENKNALAVSAGMPGFGVEYSRKLTSKLTARLQYNFFEVEDFDLGEIEIGDNQVTAIVSGESNTIDLLLDYAPFGNAFKIVGGLSSINTLSMDILMEYDESVTFGDIVLTKEDYGQLNAGLSWEGIAPYLGLGFGRAVPKSGLGFSVEFGSYFTQTPDVTLTATKLLAPTADQEEEFTKTFETWTYIPSVKFRLAYSF